MWKLHFSKLIPGCSNMERRRLLTYGPRLINILHTQLPHQVISENGLVGSSKDGHQAEATVQHLIVKLLTPHVPSPDLIRNNKQAFEHPTLGGCIPDVIVDRIGGYPWGYFELKTLLADDQLTEEAVERDLRKLCAYKETHPDAAAVFVLVGTRKRLSERMRRQPGKRLAFAPKSRRLARASCDLKSCSMRAILRSLAGGLERPTR